MDHDTLLEHTAFLQALARRLVRDDEIADDVLQQTCLQALAHGPRDRRRARSWLSRVAVNFARRTHRDRARRIRRERAAPTPPSVPSPEEVAEREVLMRRVVDAVFGLDEPYRSTVIARYYDGLRSTEIAAQTGVNEATVRTRLRRGLARLRDRLDRDCGDRASWVGGLSVLASIEIAGRAVPMLVPAKVAIVALLGSGALVGGWALAAGPDEPAVERDTPTDARRRAIDDAMRRAAALPKGATPITVGPQVGDAAPDLTIDELLQAPRGARANWEGLEGQTVVLGFWSIWCEETPSMMSRLATLQRRFADRPLRCLSISSDDATTVREYLVDYPADVWVGVDADRSTFTAYGVLMLPTIVIVDRHRRVHDIVALRDVTDARLAALLDRAAR